MECCARRGGPKPPAPACSRHADARSSARLDRLTEPFVPNGIAGGTSRCIDLRPTEFPLSDEADIHAVNHGLHLKITGRPVDPGVKELAALGAKTTH